MKKDTAKIVSEICTAIIWSVLIICLTYGCTHVK